MIFVFFFVKMPYFCMDYLITNYMLDNWQRIEQIIKWAGAASVNAFAREIGLNRGENLYQIKRGNNGISKDLAETVTAKYPAISKAWLLTGEGDMLPGKSAKLRCDIPFFKTDAVELVSMLNDNKGATVHAKPLKPGESDKVIDPDYYVSFPMMQGCDFAAYNLSEAMSPEISKGAILFFKKVTLDCLTPGNTYLVLSPTFKGIRVVRREPQSDRIRLVPRNTVDFDEVILDMGQIEGLFEVKGTFVIK